jgi:type I restriction enzyme, S subunit
MEKRRLEENDLLIVEGHANPYEIGRCALVKSEAIGLTFQNHLFRLRSRGISPRFACHWLNSEFAKRYWRRKCGTSSGLNTINQRMLKSLPVVVPGEKEQQRIVAILEAADRMIHEEYERLKKIEKLKRGLMQDLLTGRVRVKFPASDGEGDAI